MKGYLRNFFMIDIPLIIFISQILTEIYVPDIDKPAFNSEGGPLETMEAVVIGLSVPVFLYLCVKIKNNWLKLWTGVACLCAIYVTGEELSWGQFIFQWSTPEEWARLNDQHETNLHNVSSWLDQKPKALLEIGVLVGGLVVPALRRWKPEKLPEKFRDIYPDDAVVVTALFVVAVKLIDLYGSATGRHLFWRGSELTEMYLFYFVLLYALGRAFQWRSEKRI